MYKIGDLGGALVYGVYDPSTRPPASRDVPDLTTNDPGVRSYNYSAPETVIPILEKDPDGRDLWTYNDSIDFWSLGMLIYEMVVGFVLPWCKYVADGPDTILISPKQIPHIMKHVLKSHSCDPEIFNFIMKVSTRY
jgi:serine/threonine protein kinase